MGRYRWMIIPDRRTLWKIILLLKTSDSAPSPVGLASITENTSWASILCVSKRTGRLESEFSLQFRRWRSVECWLSRPACSARCPFVPIAGMCWISSNHRHVLFVPLCELERNLPHCCCSAWIGLVGKVRDSFLATNWIGTLLVWSSLFVFV